MRSDAELRKLSEQLSEEFPDPDAALDQFTKRFLELCGDCTGEELRRMGEFEQARGRVLMAKGKRMLRMAKKKERKDT